MTPVSATRLAACAFVTLSLFHFITASAGAPASSPASAAVLCPVTGKTVDREICDRFRGRWVYFATDDARKQFMADPGKFADGLSKQWSVDIPLRVQVLCPVTGEAIDPTVFIGKGLKAVYFATEDAKREWQKNTERFIERLERECYTFQTGCAACGNMIVPSARKALDGHTLYFCCMGCPRGCDADKSACIKRAEEQAAANKAAFERERSNQPTTRPAQP
jgi:YHS domain-containing protein